jgi:hypothetical protein
LIAAAPSAGSRGSGAAVGDRHRQSPAGGRRRRLAAGGGTGATGGRQPATELRTLHQLTPELAPELAACDRALFIDAWLAPGATGDNNESHPRDCLPCLRGLTIDTAAEAAFSHQLEPGQLLAMAHALFGACPRSDALLVPAYAFGHGTASPIGCGIQLPTARRLLRQWLEAGHA